MGKIFLRFNDENVEREYLIDDYRYNLKYLKYAILFFGVIFLLFALPDYYYVYDDMSSFLMTLYLRGIFFLIVINLFIQMSRKEDKYVFMPMWITFSEVACGVIYYFIICYNHQPNILIKSFDIVLIILVFNLLPNRWIYNVATSFFIFSLFTVYTYSCYPKQVNPGVIYIFVSIIIIAFFSYLFENYRRENYKWRRQLMLLKNIDPLTGIFNRSKFDEEMELLLANNEAKGAPFSLILFDIDNFKIINDSYGHIQGDQVIVKLTQIVQDSIRSTDIFTRWGGDEFIILLPNTGKLEAVELAKRIERSISEKRDNNHTVTCSFGIIEYKTGEQVADFIRRADKLMYEAKEKGKNKLQYE